MSKLEHCRQDHAMYLDVKFSTSTPRAGKADRMSSPQISLLGIKCTGSHHQASAAQLCADDAVPLFVFQSVQNFVDYIHHCRAPPVQTPAPL